MGVKGKVYITTQASVYDNFTVAELLSSLSGLLFVDRVLFISIKRISSEKQEIQNRRIKHVTYKEQENK